LIYRVIHYGILKFDYVSIVMEFANGNDLYQKIVNSKKNNKQLDE